VGGSRRKEGRRGGGGYARGLRRNSSTSCLAASVTSSPRSLLPARSHSSLICSRSRSDRSRANASRSDASCGRVLMPPDGCAHQRRVPALGSATGSRLAPRAVGVGGREGDDAGILMGGRTLKNSLNSSIHHSCRKAGGPLGFAFRFCLAHPVGEQSLHTTALSKRRGVRLAAVRVRARCGALCTRKKRIRPLPVVWLPV